MCGIVGIVSRDGETPVDPWRIRRMRDAIKHRGPDGDGLWADGAVALGHRRLAIVDPSGGRQPMANEDESVWITFNGEIYNHADLRPDLVARGHVYRSRCDTETIVHLYEEYGIDALERLRGMFAFAIWDRRHQTLVLGRDRLGIKPLYYVETDDELLFASEIKALFAAGSLKPRFNEPVLGEFLATRYVSGSETFFAGVQKLRPGHVLTWTPRRAPTITRYWNVPDPVPRPVRSLRQEASELRERLGLAVRRHLMSDVPLGLFLSGGLDSSALAALTAPFVEEPLQTFAVGFSDPEANELPYARTVARHVGSLHRDISISPSEYFAALPRLIYQEDEPIAFTSSVPLYYVSALARRHVKVVLTGEGADELFLGYNRYRITMWNERFGRPYRRVMPNGMRAAVERLIRALPRRVRRYGERTFLAHNAEGCASFLENFAVFPRRAQHRLLATPDAWTRDPYAEATGAFEASDGDLLDRMCRVDLHTYLHELLMKQDQMSMAASIESRVPFLDDEIVSYVASMPSALKLRHWQTKAILREAVRGMLPAEILTRRKMGFPVPIGRWLRHRYWSVVDEFVLGPRVAARRLFNGTTLRSLAEEHRLGLANHGDRLWLLINFEIWLRMFCEGESPVDVMRPVLGRTGVPHARALGEDGRPLAVEHWRPAAKLPHAVGTVATASGRSRHDARPGG